MKNYKNNLYSTWKKNIPSSIFQQNNIPTRSNNQRSQQSSKQDSLLDDILYLVQQGLTFAEEGKNKKYSFVYDDRYANQKLQKILKDAESVKREMDGDIKTFKKIDPQRNKLLLALRECQETICSAFSSLIDEQYNEAQSNVSDVQRNQMNQQERQISSQYQPNDQDQYSQSLESQNELVDEPFQNYFFQQTHQPSKSIKQNLQKSTKNIKNKDYPSSSQLNYFNGDLDTYYKCMDDPSLQKRFRWNDQQDDAIMAYKFDNEKKWQNRFIIVMEDKTIDSVIERYAYLGVNLDVQYINKLMNLAQRGRK